MAYMIEITEHKLDEMSECVEKMLRAGGKLMSCIDALQRGSEMGERNEGGRYGGRYGMRYGNRDEEEYPDYGEMGERRGVRGTGRYGRY